MKPPYWKDAKEHLKKKDPILKKIIDRCPDRTTEREFSSPFISLLRSVAGQQLSVKSADSIWRRFVALYDTITPESLLETEDSAIRLVGFSGQKTSYVKNIARFFIEKNSIDDYWDRPFLDLQTDLLTIKGIGRWTTEMFGIFYLNHPDIFPDGDLGVLKAVYRHYYNGEKKPIDAVLTLSEKWKPYRSVAAWYLWCSLDPFPVQY